MINICYEREHLTEEVVKNYVEEFKDIEVERIIEIMKVIVLFGEMDCRNV